ncbi:MAG: hypothetical protein JXA22_05945 [Candidatus Thermoplasmatota archaeon]|nr:hypothetical protein [Candidatus Thermoplasmatota archaeon]
MNDVSGYVICPVCKKGRLLPVTLGAGEERDVAYRCTEPMCGVRFDKHGFERYSEERQKWVRMAGDGTDIS